MTKKIRCKYILASPAFKRDIILTIFLLLTLPVLARAQEIYPALPVSTDNLYTTVKYLTELTPPRNYENPAALDRAAAYIGRRFRDYGLRLEEQRFAYDNTIYRNVIGSLGPERAARFVLGAHYDVAHNQPGADDNASGVAGLLETARILKPWEARLRYRLNFVAFTWEEGSLLRTGRRHIGSYRHAHYLKNKNLPVKGMAALEMIGYFTDHPDSQDYPLFFMKFWYPRTGNFLAVVGNFKSASLINYVYRQVKRTALPVERLAAPGIVPGIDFSDHSSYWQCGYPAVMITDTAFYRNKNYHKPTDTLATLNFGKMREAVKGVGWTLLNLE